MTSPSEVRAAPTLPRIRRMHSAVLEEPLAAPRSGVMLHYDDSASDAAALAWFRNPRCRNGYTWLVMDDGEVVELADPAKRTPHAGLCKTECANSVFYGVAVATSGSTVATEAQVTSVVRLCAALAGQHHWERSECGWIRGHDEEAIWSPAQTRNAGMRDEIGRLLWGRPGRKVDPRGVRSDGVPVLDVEEVRLRVRELL